MVDRVAVGVQVEAGVPGQDHRGLRGDSHQDPCGELEREFFIDNTLSSHLIVSMILVDRPCVMGV